MCDYTTHFVGSQGHHDKAEPRDGYTWLFIQTLPWENMAIPLHWKQTKNLFDLRANKMMIGEEREALKTLDSFIENEC